MIKNQMTRMFAMIIGTTLVMAVSGCAFSGPGTHVGGNGFTDEVSGKPTESKASKPSEPDEPDLPVLK